VVLYALSALIVLTGRASKQTTSVVQSEPDHKLSRLRIQIPAYCIIDLFIRQL